MTFRQICVNPPASFTVEMCCRHIPRCKLIVNSSIFNPSDHFFFFEEEDSKECRTSRPDPPGYRSSPTTKVWDYLRQDRLRELPQKGLTLVRQRPPTSQPRTTRVRWLPRARRRWLLSVALHGQEQLLPLWRTGPGLPSDHRCVDGERRAMEQRQPIHDPSHEGASPGHQPARSMRHGPRLSAHPSCRALQRKTSSAQHP